MSYGLTIPASFNIKILRMGPRAFPPSSWLGCDRDIDLFVPGCLCPRNRRNCYTSDKHPLEQLKASNGRLTGTKAILSVLETASEASLTLGRKEHIRSGGRRGRDGGRRGCDRDGEPHDGEHEGLDGRDKALVVRASPGRISVPHRLSFRRAVYSVYAKRTGGASTSLLTIQSFGPSR